MCGIAGIVHLDGNRVDEDILDCMTDTLAHRGPDGRGTYIDNNIGLGHRRLAILDLTDAGAQPMQSPDRNIIVTYNGEIYNFREERKLLEAKGYTFRSRCDTEVLLALYKKYGTKCVQHLRGMFAFAIYDKKRQILFCARDRAGQKPFKYFFDGTTFLFASELKALLKHPQCPREVHPEAIHHFLTLMYLPAPLTGLKGIEKLEAGCTLTLNLQTKELKQERYWTLDYSKEERRSEEEWMEQIQECLEQVVRLRMIADVPVGAFLSGGIDSGIITLLMSKLAEEPVRTFSIGTEVATHNELLDADRIAQLAHTHHYPKMVKPNVIELLPKLVQIYEEPYGDASAIPTYLVSQLASEQVKVVLCGDGGDENFAGYIRSPIALFSHLWKRLRLIHPLIRAGTWTCAQLIPNTFFYRCDRFQKTMHLPLEQRYLQYISFFMEEEKQNMYSSTMKKQNFQRTDVFYASKTALSRDSARDTLHRCMAMDFTTYLRDNLMMKSDLASMHFGLECRAPLLDHHLLEEISRMPGSLKLHGLQRKYLFKKAFAHLLPPEHLRRPKTGFRLPLDHWFRTDLKDFVTDRVLSDAPHKWEFFDRPKVSAFLDRYFRTRIDYSDYVWELLWLDEWFRQYG